MNRYVKADPVEVKAKNGRVYTLKGYYYQGDKLAYYICERKAEIEFGGSVTFGADLCPDDVESIEVKPA